MRRAGPDELYEIGPELNEGAALKKGAPFNFLKPQPVRLDLMEEIKR